MPISLCACADTAKESPTEPEETTDSQEQTDSEVLDVELDRFENVSLFFHAFSESSLAALTGSAQVVDGCLQVEEFVVVWHQQDRAHIEQLVTDLRQTGNLPVTIGGGGRSLAEEGADQFEVDLAPILDVCRTEAVWFSAPLRREWEPGGTSQ